MAEVLVINTGPLIAFERMGCLDWIGRLPFEFLCPKEVRLELDQGESAGYPRVTPSWLGVHALSGPPAAFGLVGLDLGETAVIQLGLEIKAAQVSESLHECGSRHSDQMDVWDDISAKSLRMASFSDTGAAAALYDSHRSGLDDYLHAFAPVQGQAGAMFAANGRIVGLDLFDSPATLSALVGKLVESYALDALDVGEVAAQVADEPGAMLEEVSKATIEHFSAVGEGEDLRLRGVRLSGGALVKDAHVVHLCAFRVPTGASAGAEQGGRLARASLRRGHFRA